MILRGPTLVSLPFFRRADKVKTPLCEFCLKSGILCPKCQGKVNSGEISEGDVRIARMLLKISEHYPSLQNISFHKSYEIDGVIAIVVDRGDLPHLLGYSGKILRELDEVTGKKVRVLEEGVDARKFLEDLFAPSGIASLNTIWLPDGSTETRVILSGPARRLPIDVETLKALAEKIRGITIRVEFEIPRRQM